jgi:branched-chain amino acid transport system ATP-binding protein
MTALLEIRNVSHAFGGLRALNDVSLTLDDGEVLGIIGPNGAGKSTLFNVMTGHIRPDSGEVEFGGRAVRGLPPEEMARLGVVKTFQTPRPFRSMNLAENVAVALLMRLRSVRAARAGALRHLEQVGLGDQAYLPARGASTGQRKRLEIARALATEPRVLLLDEPFGGLDIASIEQLIELLRSIRASGVTLLVIEHNLEAVQRLVDRIIALNLGEKIAEGAPAAVTANPRVVQAYLGAEPDAGS